MSTMIRELLVFTLIFYALAPASIADAQDDADESATKRTSFVALPFAFYSPETKFAAGAGALYSFRPKHNIPEARPSSVRMAATVTQRKQVILALSPELYFKDESYYLLGWFTYYRYPNKFWGIGNDTPDEAEEPFTMNYVRAMLNVQKRVAPGLYIGARYQFEHINFIETTEDGLLQAGTIPGSESGGGAASGLGFIVHYDTRDNVYYPTQGRYYQLAGVFFDDLLGSDYRFNSYVIDLREYRSLFGSHVLAFQTLNAFTGGTPPVQMMAFLGGSYWMRGYYAGRYRDRHMLTFQTEYRFPIAWRFGGAAFAGVGDVADDIDSFRLKEFKYSLGFGARFMFDTRERINVRLDFGFAKGGNAGFYAMVVEAF
jgi:hypothetical protein